MKKILAAFDGFRLSHSTLSQSIGIAEKTNSHLVGIFLEDYTYHSYRIVDLVSQEGGAIDAKRRHLDKKDEKTRAVSVAEFETACQKAGISFSVHKDRNFALRELIKESLYGDLLVINRHETLSHYTDRVPTHFIRRLLSSTFCPVLLTAEKYNAIDKLVLLFDGSPSSVYAIKMLAYTMDHLCEIPVDVICVNTFKEGIRFPESQLAKEIVLRHFPSARFHAMRGFAELEIMNYLQMQEGIPLVVLGAYRRSRLSQWFKSSLADVILAGTGFPVFIAHSK